MHRDLLFLGGSTFEQYFLSKNSTGKKLNMHFSIKIMKFYDPIPIWVQWTHKMKKHLKTSRNKHFLRGFFSEL